MELQDSKPLSSASPQGGEREGGKISTNPLSIYYPTGSAEINELPSMTIPDMSLTVKDLYQRYRLGTLPAEFVRSVLYDECDDFDSVVANYLPEYDLVDAHAELAKLRQKFELMRSRQNDTSAASKSVDAVESEELGLEDHDRMSEPASE